MRQVLSVNIQNNKSKEYKINISDDKISKLIEDINLLTAGKNKLFVISKKVYNLYAKDLLIDKDLVLVLKDGETQKNYKNYLKIIKKAIELNLTREDYIIAIGGGVIGDIVAFAASTYMRGINFIQVPTSLLAMVDSSVGGKTAIDFDSYKNIIGSFYQPNEVFINLNFLKTLDKKQYLSGIGEVIKYAFIEDSCNYKHSLFLFEYLTLCCDKLLQKEMMTVQRVIEYCLNLKIAVVNNDEKENDLRRILNFGHTFGHALETITNYKKITHGEAVIQGIFFILNWAYAQNKISYSYYRLSQELLSKYGFRAIDISKNYSYNKLIEIMKHDKKAKSDNITFILPVEKKKVEITYLTPNEVSRMFQ